MKKISQYFLALSLLNFTWIAPAQAICPVCTVAVGAGLGLTKWLGIDDTISGLWIGGLTVSLILWTIDWLAGKNIKFKGDETLIWLGYYLIIVAPLWWSEIIGHPLNTLWGIDKLILGIAIGSLFFYAGKITYDWLKKNNNNHAYFPYQKVVMPIAPLIIFSFIFYFLTK